MAKKVLPAVEPRGARRNRLRGDRTLLNQLLDDEQIRALDCLQWFRETSFLHTRELGEAGERPTKDSIFDEAFEHYLASIRRLQGSEVPVLTTAPRGRAVTAWVSTPLWAQLRSLSESLGLPLSRVTGAALQQHLAAQVTPAMQKLRAECLRKAATLYAGRTSKTPRPRRRKP